MHQVDLYGGRTEFILSGWLVDWDLFVFLKKRSFLCLYTIERRLTNFIQIFPLASNRLVTCIHKTPHTSTKPLIRPRNPSFLWDGVDFSRVA